RSFYEHDLAPMRFERPLATQKEVGSFFLHRLCLRQCVPHRAPFIGSPTLRGRSDPVPHTPPRPSGPTRWGSHTEKDHLFLTAVPLTLRTVGVAVRRRSGPGNPAPPQGSALVLPQAVYGRA